MNTLFTVLLLVAGMLAASAWILGRLPNAKPIFDKVVPFSGWIGIGLLVVSLIHLVKYVLPHLGTFLTSLNGLLALAAIVVGAGLGFLLGFGLIAGWAGGKSPEALAKAEQLRARLVAIQIPLGFAGIGLGIYTLV